MITNKIFTGILLSASVFALPACNPSANNAGGGGEDTTTTVPETVAPETTGVEATASLDAAQETEEVTSEGTGTFHGTFDEATGELTFEMEYSGLTGPPSMMHFHGPADPGADAGVKIPITGFTAEADGSVKGTVMIEEADRADLLAGKWYVNIHTEAYGAGEIRGQVKF